MLKVDEKVVLEDLGYFTKVGSASDVSSAIATCREIPGEVPRNAKTLSIEFPDMRFRD